MNESSSSTSKARPTCRCGHQWDNFWVSAEPKYSMFAFAMGIFMGVSAGIPKSVRFRCRQCQQIVEERRDKKTLLAYREH